MQDMNKKKNPVDYIKIFFRRKWLFLVPVFFGFVISIAMCFLLPPIYESSTVILVEEEKIINPLIQGLAISTSVVDRMRILKEQVLSWNSLVELTQKLQLSKDVKGQLEFEKLIKDLKNNIYVTMITPNIIKITYLGADQKLTQLTSKTLTEIFIDENMRSQSKETDVAIEFLAEQLQVYKRKIKESEIAQFQEDLKKLLIDSTQEHPLVKEYQEKINQAKEELESGEYETPKRIRSLGGSVVEALEEEIEKIIQSERSTKPIDLTKGEPAAKQEGGLYRLLLLDKLDNVRARDMQVNENIYNMLLQKLETAKITQRLEKSKEGTRYTILEPARLPLKPTKPKKILIVFVGLFLGVAGGAGLALGKEFLDDSVLDIEDAKSSFELPILGAISRLTVKEEIRRAKIKHVTIMVLMIVVSIALIIASMFVSFFRQQ